MHGTENILNEISIHGQNRSFIRHAYMERAMITLSNGEKIHCELLDLSQSGCRVRSYTDIHSQLNIRLKFSNLESQWADVIWKDEYCYGVQFRRPLSVYVVEHIVRSITSTY